MSRWGVNTLHVLLTLVHDKCISSMGLLRVRFLVPDNTDLENVSHSNQTIRHAV